MAQIQGCSNEAYELIGCLLYVCDCVRRSMLNSASLFRLTAILVFMLYHAVLCHRREMYIDTGLFPNLRMDIGLDWRIQWEDMSSTPCP
jgi:hypothetical protein